MTTLYFRFYRSFAPATILVTIACVWVYTTWGLSTLPVLFFFKMVTNLLFWYLLKQLNEKKMYYYYNQNLSKTSLWLFSFGLDFLILIISLALINPAPIPLL